MAKAKRTQDEENELRSFSLDIKVAGDLSANETDFAFQGFDPFDTLAALREKQKNKKQLAQDITALLHLANLRGTLYEKTTKRMSETGSNRIKKIVSDYGISTSTRGAASDKLSIGRIAACFPQITMKLCADGHMRDLVFSDSLPRFYRFLQAPSLFPNAMYEMPWKQWAIAVDKIINPKREDKERRDSVEQYYTVMFNSRLFTMEQRMVMHNGIVLYFQKVIEKEKAAAQGSEETKAESASDDKSQSTDFQSESASVSTSQEAEKPSEQAAEVSTGSAETQITQPMTPKRKDSRSGKKGR